jgi:hypothetical protein
LGEPSKTLTRTVVLDLWVAVLKLTYLNPGGRLTLLQTPCVLELSEEPMWEVVAVLYGYLSFGAWRYILVLDC